MILFLLILINSFIFGLFLPWWCVIPVALIHCFQLSTSLKSAFWISFLSIFCLWLVLSLYYSAGNNHILAGRVADLFGLGNSGFSWLWMVLLSPLPGAITASLAGASGFLIKQLFIKK